MARLRSKQDKIKILENRVAKNMALYDFVNNCSYMRDGLIKCDAPQGVVNRYELAMAELKQAHKARNGLNYGYTHLSRTD